MARPQTWETRLERGQPLGRYELVSPLGRGGFAEVWLARLSGKGGFEKLFAIKVIRSEHASDPAFHAMFLDEARLTASLDHPNVARVFELGEENGAPYLVMEYVRGESLHELVRLVRRASASFPPEVVVKIIVDVCAGLHAAHELKSEDAALLGVVHRDVSPNNILVTEHGDSKLIDFGVAKARDRLGADTATGMTKGTILYMSPEQAKGMPLDRRADIWAIGAVAYELLEGRPAFDAPNDVARLHALIGTTPLARFTRPVPRALEEVVRRALSRRTSERHATAAELRRDLEEALDRSEMRATSDDVAAFVLEHAPSRSSEEAEERPSLRKIVGKGRAVSEADETGSAAIAGAQMTTTARERDAQESPPETSSSFVGAPSRFLRPRRNWPLLAAIAATVVTIVLGVGFLRGRPQLPTTATTAPAVEQMVEVKPEPVAPAASIADLPVAPPLPTASTRVHSRIAAPVRRPAAPRGGGRKPAPSAHVSYEDTIQ